MEGGQVEMRLGRGERYPKFCQAENAYVIEPIEHYEEEVSRGVDGTP
jgi:hypothetical protein